MSIIYQVYFQYSSDLVENDEYYELEKQATHKLMQDDMQVASGAKAEVIEKLIRPPKKSRRVSSIVVVWKGTDEFEEILLKNSKDKVFNIKYTKDHLHFYKGIDRMLTSQASTPLLTLDATPLSFHSLKKYQVGGIITCSASSSCGKYLGFGFGDGISKVWDLQLRSYGPTLDKHSKEVTCIGFYKDWIMVTGSKDGTVQMYDLSVESGTDTCTFMNQKNYFTVVQKEKWLEDQNEIVDLIVTNCGIVFAIDKFKNGRAYSVYHGKKVFRAIPGSYFSLESLTGSKPTKTEFQTDPSASFSYSNRSIV